MCSFSLYFLSYVPYNKNMNKTANGWSDEEPTLVDLEPLLVRVRVATVLPARPSQWEGLEDVAIRGVCVDGRTTCEMPAVSL